ncbi:MAG: hypothetical protein HY033_00720 [Ignavibacteriae bacterium]|nr:hypothetical protein [Ignavibacteria bacterium]MBI3363412.1 hypothetical protein [Ignavibacteriota bacterium]
MIFNDAFDHFQHVTNVIRTNGTHEITPQNITDWNMREVHTGTLIGVVPYPNGTVSHLSIGLYDLGTHNWEGVQLPT